MLGDFKKSTEIVGLKIHPDETQILSNQGLNKRKEVTRSATSKWRFCQKQNVRSVSDKQEKFEQQDKKNQESNRSSLDIIYQVSTS